jgi:hypothetical protein
MGFYGARPITPRREAIKNNMGVLNAALAAPPELYQPPSGGFLFW